MLPPLTKPIARMQAIADQAIFALDAHKTPMFAIGTDDHICSCVAINGSFDAKETWTNGIYQNSRYFIFCIQPAKGKRCYDVGDTLQVELVSSWKPKFRKYTGPLPKILEKIAAWIEANKTS